MLASFLVKFEAFLRNSGCGNNTIYNYIKTLRALYNSAIHEEIVNIDLYPVFSDFHDSDAKRQVRVKTALKKINKTLGDIGIELDIPTPLTSYVARHTFASIMKSRGVPVSVIKEMMGHESEETTEIYTNEFGDNVLSRYSDLLDIE